MSLVFSVSLSAVTFFVLKHSLSNINKEMPTFFWLLFACCVFSPTLLFSFFLCHYTLDISLREYKKLAFIFISYSTIFAN